MSTFTNITVEDYTNHKSDGKKLKKLQEHVPELQGRINTLAEEYRRELAVEKARVEAAELALAEEISKEETRAKAIEGGLRNDLETEASARVAGDLAEKTRAELAETALSQAVSAEEASGLNADGTFPNHADSNYMSMSTTAHASRERLDTALSYTDQMLGTHAGAPGVFTVSLGAKNAKTYSVDSEGNESYSSSGLTVKQAAINLSGAIDREKARAESAEGVALADRRQIKEDFAQADGEATTDRGRIRTEMVNAVGVEKSRAESAEAVLRADLLTEAADRLSADTAARLLFQLVLIIFLTTATQRRLIL